ncbi:MAG: hypothetical protein KC589_01790 [Nanoarchaeota archaeon]|nr:hypothetical protein [Nanoarchaeota archaeon]
MCQLSDEIQNKIVEYIDGQFKKKRKSQKYKKLEEDNPIILDLIKQYEHHNWMSERIEKIYKIINDIKVSTHISKAIYPSSNGSNLYILPSSLYKHNNFGTHILSDNFDVDISINAGYLDIANFLLLKIDSIEKSLFELLLEKNENVIRAFINIGIDNENVNKLCDIIETIIIQDKDTITVDGYLKQLYWTDDNNKDYLLIPFYPSSLLYNVYNNIKNNKSEYSDIAIIKLGGTKPQNISILNNKKNGVDYLLPSLPPIWSPIDNMEIVIPHSKKSLFDVYKNRKDVWKIINEMNIDEKNTNDCIDRLVDHFIEVSIMYQDILKSGWSNEENIKILDCEKFWFDPYRSLKDNLFKENWIKLDWCDNIIDQFVRSIISKLKHDIDDSEYIKWKEKLKNRRYWKERIKQLHKEIIKSK